MMLGAHLAIVILALITFLAFTDALHRITRCRPPAFSSGAGHRMFPAMLCLRGGGELRSKAEMLRKGPVQGIPRHKEIDLDLGDLKVQKASMERTRNLLGEMELEEPDETLAGLEERLHKMSLAGINTGIREAPDGGMEIDEEYVANHRGVPESDKPDEDDILAYKLFDAVKRGDLREVQEHVGAGADFDRKDDREDNAPTAIHHAAMAGHADIITWLVSKGADFEDEDLDFRTPLHLAARAGHDGCIAVLLGMGAKWDRADSAGATALHVAAREGHVGAVLALLEGGADPAVRDFLCRRPYDVAVEGGKKAAGVATILEGKAGSGKFRVAVLGVDNEQENMEPDQAEMLRQEREMRRKLMQGDDTAARLFGMMEGERKSYDWAPDVTAGGHMAGDAEGMAPKQQDLPREAWAEIEQEILKGSVGGIGNKTEEEVEKELEAKQEALAQKYKSLQAEFPYEPIESPEGVDAEEVDMVDAANNPHRDEVARAVADLDARLKPMYQKLVDETVNRNKAMEEPRNKATKDESEVDMDLGVHEADGVVYGWTPSGRAVKVDRDIPEVHKVLEERRLRAEVEQAMANADLSESDFVTGSSPPESLEEDESGGEGEHRQTEKEAKGPHVGVPEWSVSPDSSQARSWTESELNYELHDTAPDRRSRHAPHALDSFDPDENQWVATE